MEGRSRKDIYEQRLGRRSTDFLQDFDFLLLDPQIQFDSFGYDAENKYVELAENEQHQGWLLLRRFKMILHNKTVV